MASLNKVMLMGNLTRDPEIRYTPKGMAVSEVAIAVNRKYRVENETREEVTYVDITFWGKQAEVVTQWMKKGKPIYVEGRLQMDSWDDKATGQKRYKMKVVAEDFQFLGGPRDGNAGGGGTESGSYPEDSGGSPRNSGGGGSYSNAPAGGDPSPQYPSGPGPSTKTPPGAFSSGLDDEDEIPF